MKGEDTGEMVLWWGFFITLFFLPPCSFGSVKTKSVTVNCQAREAHMPISSSISSPCLHRAVVSLSVLGEIWLLCTCYSIRMLHFLAYSSSPPCCWIEIHVSSWAKSVLLIDSCGDEPWLSIRSWLSGLDITILHDLRNNTQPLPLRHFEAISGRPAGRNTEVGCSRHYIPLHHC